MMTPHPMMTFVYGLPTSSGGKGQHIVELGSGESRGAVPAFLQ